jgi:hypothetical protein
MGKAFWGWVCWFIFLFIVDFTIPFRALKEVQTVSGSFLFWIIWMAVAIVSMFAIFLRWGETGKKS